ncbi:MAG: PEP-CTERM sorting domain-containing protein [Pirellulaceae bacterium]|nr:PEP-CTERM sorting domain-containing protein [Pirellulaceae bacterium]
MSSKYCVLALLAAFVFAFLPAATLQAESIHGHWQFNEKADGEQATGAADEFLDSSGNGNHGTWLTGRTLPFYRTAPSTPIDRDSPSALDFSYASTSTSRYVTVPHSDDLNLNLSQLGTHTIDVIFKSAVSEAPYAALYAKGTNQGLIFRGGKMEVYLVHDGLSVYLTAQNNTVVNDNQWHNVQVKFDIKSDPSLSSLTYYLDGVQDGSYLLKDIAYQQPNNYWPANIDITNTDPLTIGWGISTAYTNYNFRGQISMLKLAYTPIPEPSTLALLACGLIGLLAYAWRKRK